MFLRVYIKTDMAKPNRSCEICVRNNSYRFITVKHSGQWTENGEKGDSRIRPWSELLVNSRFL